MLLFFFSQNIDANYIELRILTEKIAKISKNHKKNCIFRKKLTKNTSILC